MKYISILLALIGTCILMAAPGAAYAQATRTWVSGVGDDANPCSRTAPCKTFAGSIVKTAPGGEVDVLDPGGFGAVTITKAITLASDGAGEGGITNPTTNAINVSAGANDVVVIRGLQLEGVGGQGLTGIKFNTGKALFVFNTTIRNDQNSGSGYGIWFAPSTGTAQLFVTNSQILANGTVGAGTGAGIFIAPTGSANVNATIVGSQVSNNTAGIRVDTTGDTGGSTFVQIANSEVSGNANGAIAAITGATASPATIVTDRSTVANNAVGFTGNGSKATVRVGNTMVMNNGMAFKQQATATLTTFGTNEITDNTPGGYTPTPVGPS